METDRLVSEAFLEHHPIEAARTVEACPLAAVAAFLAEAAPDDLAPVVAAMDPTVAAHAVGEMDAGVAATLVEALPAHAASVLLRRLGRDASGPILDRLSPRAGARVRTLLRYPAGSAGALLDPAVLTMPPDLTVREALQRVRDADAHVHYYLFVVDRRGSLLGVVSLRELLGAASDALIGAVAHRTVATLPATADRDVILAHPSWSDLHALPVVDAGGRFLGIVRHETLRQLESEARATPLGSATVAAALDLGEVAWTAGAALLGEVLAAAGAPQSARSTEAGGSASARRQGGAGEGGPSARGLAEPGEGSPAR